MRVSILGSLEVSHEGGRILVTAPKQRALLAYLSILGGEPASTDTILEALWGDEQPTQPLRTLRFHVSKLRTALRDGGLADEVIDTVPGGYRIADDSVALDSVEFAALANRGAELLEEDPAEALVSLQRAEVLWRGPALADFTYDEFAQPFIRRLTAHRLVAAEDRFEAQLALGSGASLLPELEQHTATYPYRERGWGQLMVARYRTGDSAGALRAFEDARRVLGESLGIEPGPDLQDLEDAVLQNRSELLGRAPTEEKLGTGTLTLLATVDDMDNGAGAVERWAGQVRTDGEQLTALFETLATAASAAAELVDSHGRVYVTDGDETDFNFEELSPGTVAVTLRLDAERVDEVLRRAGLLDTGDLTSAGAHIWRATRHDPAGPMAAPLPLPEDSFLGRGDQVERVVDSLAAGRLVTVVGPGGVGKTRLALEALSRLARQDTSQTVSAVGLVTVDGPSVPAAVIEAVGAVPSDRSSVATLVQALDDRPRVILLDNCEHVLEEIAGLVNAVLAARPSVTFVATSRKAIDVRAEVVIPLDPLSDEAAVQLFRDRADAAGADLTASSNQVLLEICRRLECVPLAIELAASRARTMEPEALLDAVVSSTSFLERRSGDHHATLQSAVQWSIDLLSEDLRAVTGDVTVFRGPFRPASAAAVLNQESAGVVLSDLADWSLLRPARIGGVPTFRMLSIIREHVPLGEERRESLRGAHLDHYADWAANAAVALHGPGDIEEVARISAEFANFREAYMRAVGLGHLEIAAAIIDGLWIYSIECLRFEVHDWADSLTELEGFGAMPEASQIMGIAGQGAWLRGDLTGAADRLKRAFETEDQHDLPPALAPRYALAQLVAYASQVNRIADLGDLAAQLPQRFREMVEWCRASGDPYWLVHSFGNSSMGMAVAGDEERSLRYARRAMDSARESGASGALAWAELVMGMAMIHSDRQTAASYLDASIDRAVAGGNRFLYGVVLAIRATLQLEDDGPHEAASSIGSAIRFWRDIGNKPQFWHAIELAAVAAHLAGNERTASSLMAAANRTGGFMPMVGVSPDTLAEIDAEAAPSVVESWSADEAADAALAALAELG